MRASNAADARGDHVRAQELLDAARAEDSLNPAIVLHDARSEADPDKTLEQLSRIVAVDDDQAAAVEIVRVEALMAKRDFEQAREALARVRSLQVDGRGADELEADLVVTEAQVRIADDTRLTPGPLLDAAQTLLSLANAMRDQQRWQGAAILTGRAIVAFALADNSRRASRVLDKVMADERLLTKVEARRLFAGGALLLQRLDDVLTLVPDGEDETDRLDRAAAHVMSGDPERGAGAIDDLIELMNADGEGAVRAGYLLLCASANNLAVPWNQPAEQIVAAEQPQTVTMLRAFRLATEGDFDRAEAHLRPHSDNPDALRFLAHLAGRREEYPKAVSFAQTLVRRTGAASDRLQLAALLARNGDHDEAIEQLVRLARDPRSGFDQRSDAFARAARLLQEAERFPGTGNAGPGMGRPRRRRRR